MKPLKAMAGVALIFLFGVVFGAMNGAKWMERQFRTRLEQGLPAVSEMVTRRLARSLSLPAEQGDEVRAIVTEAQQKLASLRERQEPEVREIVLDAQTSIRALLTREQAEEFDRLVQKSESAWMNAGR